MNIRNASSPHRRGWLAPRSLCIVPATSFCEYAHTKPKKTPIWFVLREDRWSRAIRAMAGAGSAARGGKLPSGPAANCTFDGAQSEPEPVYVGETSRRGLALGGALADA